MIAVMMEDTDLVATWNVPLSKKTYTVKFEHGTTTGKRIIYVDDKVVLKRDYMFKLVGKESFNIEKFPCTISIDAMGIFSYEYCLEVNGKAFEKFQEQQKKSLIIWCDHIGGIETRICLDKETMDVWVNGNKIETTGEFLDDGTNTHFTYGSNTCIIRSKSSGKKQIGLVYTLTVNGKSIESENSKEDRAKAAEDTEMMKRLLAIQDQDA
uniref:Fas apoptotic inhibitory molecule 1 n=1 Tax=Rhabditophanes sp. KR3021 TaxID=114890 RepID=A0AC35UHF0_9BILA